MRIIRDLVLPDFPTLPVPRTTTLATTFSPVMIMAAVLLVRLDQDYLYNVESSRGVLCRNEWCAH